jgi:peptidoglycan/LPS O-acetylase OafA/YrhL
MVNNKAAVALGRKGPSTNHDRRAEDGTDPRRRQGTIAAKHTLSFYRPELDVLRFLAFLLVFFHHMLPQTADGYGRLGKSLIGSIFLPGIAAGGSYGVDLFFALSAYLITAILLKEHHKFGKIDVKAFYARRILRIWPLYFTALLLIPPVMHYFISAQQMSGRYLAAYVLLSGNWACALWGFPSTAVTPLWSVSIEEQFYLTWPLIMNRWVIRHMYSTCIIFLASAYLTRAILVHNGARHPAIWCNTLARLDPIVLGVVLAYFLNGKIPSFRATSRVMLIGFGLVTLVLAGRFGGNEGRAALFTFPAVSIASLSLLVGTIGIETDFRSNALGRVLIHLGRISYGLYVFHYPLIVLLSHSSLSPIYWRLTAIALTGAVAYLSYRYLESPFLRLKSNFAYVGSFSDTGVKKSRF